MLGLEFYSWVGLLVLLSFLMMVFGFSKLDIVILFCFVLMLFW